jgi:hypothetical protein
MSAAAVIIRRRKRFIRRFRGAGATSPDRAIPFAQVNTRRSWVFDRLVSHGVIVEAGPDRYYLDENAAEVFMRRRRRRALLITGVILAVWLVIVAISLLV